MLASGAVGAELEAEEAARGRQAPSRRLPRRRRRAPASSGPPSPGSSTERLHRRRARAWREPAREHAVRLGDRVDEAGAPREQVVGGRAVGIPSSSARSADVVGNIMSGVTVAHDQEVDVATVDARVGERLDAPRAARSPTAPRRPRRSAARGSRFARRIHSSDVSTNCARSSFVITGRARACRGR